MIENSSKSIENKCNHWAFRSILIGKPAHRKGILSMFELGRKPSQVVLVVFLDQKSQKSQRISVPTDRQTLSMHRYLLIESHHCSVGTPLQMSMGLGHCKSTFPSSLQKFFF